MKLLIDDIKSAEQNIQIYKLRSKARLILMDKIFGYVVVIPGREIVNRIVALQPLLYDKFSRFGHEISN